MTSPTDLAERLRPEKYRKRPVVIEAIQWTGLEKDLPAVFEFIGDFKNLPDDGAYIDGPGIGYTPLSGSLFIPTKEGTMEAAPGDFIIKGVEGEFYPCKPSIFAATYDRLSALESAASGAVTDEDAMKKAADAWGCAGEFIDALVGAFAARYPELSPHRDELNERLCKLVAATITASKHSPRLAKAEQRRVVCPSCGVAFDRSSKWARDASSEPAPSEGQRSTCQWGAYPELGGWKCSVHGGFKAGAVVVLAFPCDKAPNASEGAQRMARDDAKKGKVSDG